MGTLFGIEEFIREAEKYYKDDRVFHRFNHETITLGDLKFALARITELEAEIAKLKEGNRKVVEQIEESVKRAEIIESLVSGKCPVALIEPEYSLSIQHEAINIILNLKALKIIQER